MRCYVVCGATVHRAAQWLRWQHSTALWLCRATNTVQCKGVR